MSNNTMKDIDERTNLAANSMFELLLFRLGEAANSERRELFGEFFVGPGDRDNHRIGENRTAVVHELGHLGLKRRIRVARRAVGRLDRDRRRHPGAIRRGLEAPRGRA